MMRRKSLDVVLLFVLVIARVRIDTLADLVLPNRHGDVAALPWVQALLSARGMELLGDWLTDPISLLLITLTFAALGTYLFVDVMVGQLGEERAYRLKMALVWLIVLSTVIGKSALLISLRHTTGPAAYTHDGGVIQTEETIKYILAGKNPYVEDYRDTPMAEWGLDYRTALDHYPYLPWTFLFSAPFYLVSRALLGWYDQRFVYLLLFIVMLALTPRLARGHTDKLALVMILGLNPIMGSDVIFGQNDSFVLFWIVLSLWLLDNQHRTLAALTFCLACVSKPTAWFFAPFYFLYFVREEKPPLGDFGVVFNSLGRQVIPFLVVFAVVMLPFAAWDWGALVDDVWGWSSGTSATAYQIRGWGLSNLVLGLGLVDSRRAYFPFWIPELLLGLPLFALLIARQFRHNTLRHALYGYGFLLFTFFYFSRFLNENYLGYILALVTLAYFVREEGRSTPTLSSPVACSKYRIPPD